MFKVFIDYIYTVDIYLIELIKVDSENNVLSCLEKYEVNNVDDAFNLCLDIQDRYADVTFYTESETFDSVTLTRMTYNKEIINKYIH